MEIFVWLLEYGLIMDGHTTQNIDYPSITRPYSGNQTKISVCYSLSHALFFKFKHVSKKIFTIKQIYQNYFTRRLHENFPAPKIYESQRCLLLLLHDTMIFACFSLTRAREYARLFRIRCSVYGVC